MKKLLCFVILILVLSGCAPSNSSPEVTVQSSLSSGSSNGIDSTGSSNTQYCEAPYAAIHVIGKENILKIRGMINADEKEFMDFVKEQQLEYKGQTISIYMGRSKTITKQDFVDLLELIDTKIVPMVPDIKTYALTYYPGYRITIGYTTKSGEIFLFDLPLHSEKTNVEEAIENNTKAAPELLYQQREGQVKVYGNSMYSTSKAIWFCLDINGQLVESFYKNDNVKNHLELKAEDIYKNLTFGLIKDIP